MFPDSNFVHLATTCACRDFGFAVERAHTLNEWLGELLPMVANHSFLFLRSSMMTSALYNDDVLQFTLLFYRGGRPHVFFQYRKDIARFHSIEHV